MKQWREMECEEKLLPIIKKYGKDLTLVDQDAINCALHCLIQTLPMRYNLITFYIGNEYKAYVSLSKKSQDSINEALIAPVIIHYVGAVTGLRPWHKDYKGAYMKEWRNNKDISPWKDEPLLFSSPLRRIRRKIRQKVLRKPESFNCTSCTKNMPCAVKRGK